MVQARSTRYSNAILPFSLHICLIALRPYG